MAFKTSDEYKAKIYDPYTEHLLQITINDDFIVNQDYIENFEIDDESFEGDTFTLGSAITCGIKLSLDVNAIEGINLQDIKKMSVKYGLYLNEDEIEYVPIGEFDVITSELRNEFIVDFQLEDYMNRFDDEYDGSKITPCTRYELVKDMCSFFKVELGSESFINGDKIVAVYDNTINAKSWLSFISERAGGFSKFRYDGKLYIRSYGETDECTIDEERIGDETVGEEFTISKILYENGIQLFEAGDEAGTTVHLTDENPLSCTQEEIDAIYESLKNIKFQSVDIQIFVDPAYETGDKLKYGNVNSFIRKKCSYNGGFDGGYKITLNNSEKIQPTNKLTNSQKINKVQSTINEITGEIDIISQLTDENTSEIANLNIKTDSIQSSVTNIENEVDENYNEITQTVNNLMVSIQNSGGTNLIKNSVMFAYDNDGIPNDWEISGDGTLSIQSSNEAIASGGISGNTFTLNNKIAKQRVNVKPDNSDIPQDEKSYYTFACKVKKNNSGTGYIKISNESEEYIINFANGDNPFYSDYEIKSLLPTTGYYDIEFYGSADSDLTFTDNIFALGQYKTQWQQASGEMMNTQVNINMNGVLVKSSIYKGDYTVMSPLEFAGYSMINGSLTKVFTLNKDTTEATKIRVTEEFTMPPIKVVPISGEISGWALVPSSKDGGAWR